MNSLIIGMGIGQLYKNVLTNLNAKITTVDPDISKGADFPTVESAILARGPFDTAHICTPNWTHSSIATQLAHDCKIVFIEKPGLKTASNWMTLVHAFPETRFMMVKNNMWRDTISDYIDFASRAKKVNLNWINKDRIPSPGTWFTTKELAFGGVSRDLMPHLLSLYISMNPNWEQEPLNGADSLTNWKLSDLKTTDYGTVKSDGTYDVDDECYINFGDKWTLTANWKSLDKDKRNIEFVMQNDSVLTFELGLCPEYAYQNMIEDAYKNKNNDEFWKSQLLQDYWIHERMELF